MPPSFRYADGAFLGIVLSHLFLGLYITMFALYMHIRRVRKSPFVVVDYGVIALFSCTVLTITLDTVQQFWTVRRGSESPLWLARINATTSTLSITLDFMSQIILIYRCWNVWDRVTWMVIPPGFLAVTSWVCGLTVTIDLSTVSDSYQRVAKDWWMPLGVTSMGLSLAVNALVSGLMVSRIWHVYRRTSGCTTANIVKSPLAWIVSALLESAVALFIAQLIYMVLYQLGHPAFALVAGPVTIIYGLNCTAIMVRVAMNRSYDIVGTVTPTQHSTMAFAPQGADAENSEVSSSTVRGQANWDTQTSSIGDQKV